jgi:large subunit ribosomal protein L3
MLNGILGTKIDQTQKFTSQGDRVPITRIQAGPCSVVQIKTKTHDGYGAIQLGFGRRKKAKKPMEGRLKKSQIKTPPLFLREIRVEQPEISANLKVGDEIKVEDVFKSGDIVDVTGISKGKGFAGVVKRWGFKGGPRTHGQSDRERAPGSIGATTTPGRVWKGKKMAGHMGHATQTVKNLQVYAIDRKKNLLLVKGLVPGPRGGLLIVKRVKEGKPLVEVEEKQEEKQEKQERTKEENAN